MVLTPAQTKRLRADLAKARTAAAGIKTPLRQAVAADPQTVSTVRDGLISFRQTVATRGRRASSGSS
jgi:hypothetical protein